MFLGYDEVAHHSGIERAETLRELAKVDRQLARLERAVRDAPRPYEIVVLADHGQTQGATFRQRYGVTLEQLVSALAGSADVAASKQGEEGWGYLSAAATEVAGSKGALAVGVRAATRDRQEDGVVSLGAQRDETGKRQRPAAPPAEKPRLVVMASGCLGLVYLTDEPGRVTLERLEARYPRLVAGLRDHPGVGFVLVHSEELGPVALGRDGVHVLEDGAIEGVDPLAPFGPNAARHVLRTSGFPHCADIVVNSTFWEETGEVAAFEELVGSHGGMGGTQAHPFVLHPSRLHLPDEGVIGAEHLHLVLRGWLAELGHTAYAAPFVPAHEPGLTAQDAVDEPDPDPAQ
jgi:hypothetical protein